MPDPTPPQARRSTPLLLGAGVVVIALGFGLPHLFVTTAPVRNPEPSEPATKPAPTATEPPGPPAAAPELGWSLLRLAVGLVVVCGLCVLAARHLNLKPTAATGAMEVMASLRVGPRCAVHLVRAGGRKLLVGTDPSGVKALVELPPDEPDPVTPPSPPTPAATAPEPAPVVVGPVRVAVDVPRHDDILAVLAKLRSGAPSDTPSPG